MRTLLSILGLFLVGCSMDGQVSNSIIPEPVDPPKPYVRAETSSVAQLHLVLPRLRASTGVEYLANAAILNVVNTYQPALSGGGDLTDFSTQLSLGSMEIVASFCGAAVTRESAAGAQKVVYKGIDLTQTPAALSEQGKREFIQNLNLRFLARPATGDEVQIGLNAMDQILASYPTAPAVTGGPSQSNVRAVTLLAQTLCTIFGASVASLLY